MLFAPGDTSVVFRRVLASEGDGGGGGDEEKGETHRGDEGLG